MEILFDAAGSLAERGGSGLLFGSPFLRARSGHPCADLRLSRGRRVLLEGGVYGVSSPRLKALFEKHAPAEAARRFEGDLAGVLVEGPDKAVVFADAFNRTEVFY